MSDKQEEFEKWYHTIFDVPYYKGSTLIARLAWDHQQARINKLEAALKEIANIDYRGNRSTESQIAFKVINKEPV